MYSNRAVSLAKTIQTLNDEYREVEREFSPQVAETQAAIGEVAKSLYRKLVKFPGGKPQSIYEGLGSSWGPLERIITPPYPEKPVAGFQTLTTKEITIATWKWQRVRRVYPVVQLSFDDQLQQRQREDPKLAGFTGYHASINVAGAALFNYSSTHTEAVNLRYDNSDKLREAFPRVHLNALGIASLVAAGVVAAYNLDPETLPLQPLQELYKDWETKMDIVDVSEHSQDSPPIQVRTTIPHLVRLLGLEALYV